jgi:hypothetical protein
MGGGCFGEQKQPTEYATKQQQTALALGYTGKYKTKLLIFAFSSPHILSLFIFIFLMIFLVPLKNRAIINAKINSD